MTLRHLAAVAALTAALPSAATPFLWAGHLEEDGVPVDGTVSITFVLSHPLDDEGRLEDPSLVVIDGNFVVELEGNFDATPAEGVYSVSIIINGVDLGTQPVVSLWPAAATADEATVADAAATASAIADLGGDPVALAALAAGDVPVAFGNVADFPAGFADGDQGIDLTPSVRFSFANNTISIVDGSLTSAHVTSTAQLTANDFVPSNVVTNADLQDDGLDAADFNGTIPVTALANGTLRAGAFSASQNRTTLFRISNAQCANVGTLTTSASCTALDTCPNGVERRDCNGTCANVVNSNCSNTAVGDLVFKP